MSPGQPPEAAERDLGAFAQPIFVFGGPCSNLEATTAVLAEARRRGFPPARIICTGDVVAYCADAQATVDAVRAAGIHVVMGNCEESLGFDKADCGCGFPQGSTCDRLAGQWFAHARATLDDGARAWMRALPRRLRLTMNGRRLAVIHGGGGDIARYVFASTPAADKAAELDRLDADGVIGGHAGLPFTDLVEDRLWHNAGSVGLPANDGTPRAWFSVLAPGGDGIAITHHPLDYDHARAAAKMRAAGLPAAYARTLEDGLWPDMRVLPEAERRLRARPLTPGAVHWSAGERRAAR
ncbi:MAG: metallophosphoesterase family protein [Proteobacteria bacterium]|nr:metallophosphoesterase family protein [Pseudomonadota bacterium]